MKTTLLGLGALMGFVFAPSVLRGQVHTPIPKIAVTTYHYDNFRTGWNSHEGVLNPTLTPLLPIAEKFGLLQTVALDDTVYAQPLIVPDVTIAGGNFPGKHDVVYVVTESNTVYAIDANSGVILLQRTLGPAVPRPSFCDNGGLHVGIESTPVIELTHQAMYLISYVTLFFGQPEYMIHAIDITTLADQRPPVVVSATHTLTDGSTFSFKAGDHRQRAALLFEDGNIYAAFASWCDNSPARGWLLGWSALDLQPLVANILTNRSPVAGGNELSSIWMSGYGVAAVAGHLYFTTGNSPANSPDGTYSAPSNLSESVVKVSAGLAHVLDFFTPSDVVHLNHHDLDLGSGGVLLLPDQPGSIPRMAVAAGKDGRMFLLNRNDMGGFSLTNNHVLGEYPIGVCFCGQSYYPNNIVTSGGSQVGVWLINTSPSPSLTQIHSADIDTGGDGGFFTAVSSNGNANVIIWAVSRHHSKDGGPDPTLYAFQPIPGTPQLKPLFKATAGRWDVPYSIYGANSNIVPVVANGHVYVASYKELDIFGFGPPVIIHPAAPAATPPSAPPPAVSVKSSFGIITKVEGSRFTMKTEAGTEVQVDAEKAIKDGLSPVLVIGQPVSIYGATDAQGVVHAEVIKPGHMSKKP
jgi:outer membrane protein assembly factor BamB